jgi:hypothetical protein
MRRSNQEVRKLLHLWRRPHQLERERLAVMLRQATNAIDARAALQCVMAQTFDRTNAGDRLRFESIERCDVEGKPTRAVARELGLSMRQFFRIRAEAITALAVAIERTLRKPPDSYADLLQLAQAVETIDPKAALGIYLRLPPDRGETAFNIIRVSVWAGIEVSQEQIDRCQGPWRLLAKAVIACNLVSRGEDAAARVLRDELRKDLTNTNGMLYDVVAFELAFLDRCDAVRLGDVVQSRKLLTDLRLFAGQNEELQAKTLLQEADQASMEGDLTAAAVAIEDVERLEVHKSDFNIMARTALAKAMLSLARGYYHEAHELANGASLIKALSNAAFAWRAAGVAGRAALFCGAPWSPPPVLVEKYPEAWPRALAEAVRGRHLVRRDPHAALAASEFALELASRRECPAYKAYAQVSVAGSLDALGEPGRASQLRIAAWETGLRLGDQFTLYDLFYDPAAPVRDVGPMNADDAFVSVVARHVARDAPPFSELNRIVGAEQSSSLVRRCLEWALAPKGAKRQGYLRPHTHEPGKTEVALGYLKSVGEHTARALAWYVAPDQREAFAQRFASDWHTAGYLTLGQAPDAGASWEEAV